MPGGIWQSERVKVRLYHTSPSVPSLQLQPTDYIGDSARGSRSLAVGSDRRGSTHRSHPRYTSVGL